MQLERTVIPVMKKRQAAASSPGTCGELVQGQFLTGEDFLVTFPVNLWSEVRLELDFTTPKIQCTPGDKYKTRLAVRKTLDFLEYPLYGAKIHIISDIPEGKGMASSTADIISACRATGEALGSTLTPEEISRIAIEIEPSDGLMYPGAVCYNHRRGRLIETLGVLPQIDILAVDLGNFVDTLQFNQIPKNYSVEELSRLEYAYDLVRSGIREKDLSKVGMATKISAQINQRLLPKPSLDALIEIADLCGAIGVCVAHSGAIVGLLFDQGKKEAIGKAKNMIWQRIAPMLMIYELRSM